jgi:hypothetical protein
MNRIRKVRKKLTYRGCELTSPIYQQIVKEKRKVEARGLEWTPNIYKPQTSAL